MDKNLMMARLLQVVSPNSTMSQAGNMDAYQRYVQQAQIQGQQPMPFEQFQQMQQQQPQQSMMGR